MAEVIVKFDSGTKNITVTVDGEARDDIQSVSFYKRCYYSSDESDGAADEPEFRFDLVQCREDEDTKLNTMTRTFASEEGHLVMEPVETGKAKDAKATADIADFFSGR